MAEKKTKTSKEEYFASVERVGKLERRKSKLSKRPIDALMNKQRIDKLDAEIRREESKQAFILHELENPAPQPRTVITDNSRRTVFAPQTDVSIASKNEAKAESKIEGSLHFHRGSKKTASAPQEGKKKLKVKTIFFCVVAVLVLAGVIAVTVKITNCVHDSKDNSSCIHSVQIN